VEGLNITFSYVVFGALMQGEKEKSGSMFKNDDDDGDDIEREKKQSERE
jgi:hypothetical protein